MDNAHVEINLNVLEDNVNKIFSKIENYNKKIIDLRNNAFGFGIYVVNKLWKCGFDAALVSTLKEATILRKYNREIPVIVLKELTSEFVYEAINNNLTLMVGNLDYLNEIAKLNIKDNLNIQLLIDNGANKDGFSSKEQLEEAIEIITNKKHLVLDGLYTNITTYGLDDDYYYEQVDTFLKMIKDYQKDNITVYANEPLMYHKKLDLINGIKLDLSVWGLLQHFEVGFANNFRIKSIDKKYNENAFDDINLNLDVAFSITSTVSNVVNVKKGSLVGKSYKAAEDMRVALVDIGHKDGITKAIKVLVINKEVCKVIADDIDLLYVAVNNDVVKGDKVYLISDYNNIENVLINLKTNRYYLTSILNNRLPRVYLDKDTEEEIIY